MSECMEELEKTHPVAGGIAETAAELPEDETDLDELYDDLEIDRDEVENILKQGGYEYNDQLHKVWQTIQVQITDYQQLKQNNYHY